MWVSYAPVRAGCTHAGYNTGGLYIPSLPGWLGVAVGRMACVPKNGMLSHSLRRLQRVETGSGGGEPTVLGQVNAIN